jgi:hypothetical protein
MFDKINYAVGEISKNWDDRWWWRSRFQNHVIGRIQRKIYDGGIDVIEQDWDLLIIIDACRADLFEETVLGDGAFDEYSRVNTKASATMEWMEMNFADGEWGDTVYVSANPWITQKASDSFHHIENLWISDYGVEEETLKESTTLKQAGVGTSETVNATETTDRALEVAHEYPDKRIIVHYLQPHAPYIGNADGSEKPQDEIKADLHPGKPHWEGKIDAERCWDEYRENLKYVMNHVWRFLDHVQGKAVVSSDHGEMFGEWMTPFPMRGYDHPMGLRTPELIEVPWAVLNRKRRDIINHGIDEYEMSDEERTQIKRNLRDLGYEEEVDSEIK